MRPLILIQLKNDIVSVRQVSARQCAQIIGYCAHIAAIL